MLAIPLVQQRLKSVMVLTVDDRDVDGQLAYAVQQ
jgi:hypothetical protein